MKSQSLLYTKINSLPEQIQMEALDFIDFLIEKYKFSKKKINNKKESKVQKKTPKFGSAKGIITYMADDFDAPLDDFKEYMY